MTVIRAPVLGGVVVLCLSGGSMMTEAHSLRRAAVGRSLQVVGCPPQADATCMRDTVLPFIHAAHNGSLDNRQKNILSDQFCKTTCAQTYTDHTAAVIKGNCNGTTDVGRFNIQGMHLCARLRFDNVLECVEDWVDDLLGDGTPSRHHDRRHSDDDDDDDDDDDNDHRDRHHHDRDDGRGGHSGGASPPPQSQQQPEDNTQQTSNTTTTTPVTTDDEQSSSSSSTAALPSAAFRNDRPGTALGCLRDQHGDLCADKMGCVFWRSCCAGAWVVLSSNTGYALNDTMVTAIDRTCPGARDWISGSKGICV